MVPPRLRLTALQRLLPAGAKDKNDDGTATGTAAAAPPSPCSAPLRAHHHHSRHASRPITLPLLLRRDQNHHKPKTKPHAAAKPPPPGFGPRDDARSFFWGTLGLAALAYAAGAAPWSLHLIFLCFFFLALPMRAVSFWRQKWQFFLIDYCYAAAAAAAFFLLFVPDDPRAEAVVYALTEGPLAAALAAWQCRWQLGSLEHTVSTHLHLLPGLAIVAHRYAAPAGVRGWRAIGAHVAATAREAGEAVAAGVGWPLSPSPPMQQQQRQRLWSPWTGTTTQLLLAGGGGGTGSAGMSAGATTAPTPIFRLFRPPEGDLPTPQNPRPLFLWLVAAPLAFYLAWQLCYFLIVQILCRDLILRDGYDTSYRCLARRAAKNNNVWNRLVRKGGALRRCAAYGALQFAFTVASVVGLAAPAYLLGPRAGALVQVAKLATPLWYGALFQCYFGAPKKAFDAGARWAREQQQHQEEEEDGGVVGNGALPPAANRPGSSFLMESVSAGVVMAAGLGSGDGPRGAVAGREEDDDEDDDATSKMTGGGGGGAGLERVEEERRSTAGGGGGGGSSGEAVVARAWLRRHQSIH